MNHVPVESSVLASVLYLPDQRVLEVQFRSGLLYQYLDVPQQTYVQLLQAKSTGRYFNTRIRNRFASRRIDASLNSGSAAS